jgi:hypothetical protein
VKGNKLNSKFVAAVFASAYCFYYANSTSTWHFIDNIDLVIHEAGHAIFAFFGDFIHVLMGSGFQTLFPAVFVGYFALKKAWYSASIVLMWVGINLVNVSVYAGDAQRMQLPLLGNGEHDWNWIFSQLGVLQYTDSIASMIYLLGVVVLVVACSGALYYAWQDFS